MLINPILIINFFRTFTKAIYLLCCTRRCFEENDLMHCRQWWGLGLGSVRTLIPWEERVVTCWQKTKRYDKIEPQKSCTNSFLRLGVYCARTFSQISISQWVRVLWRSWLFLIHYELSENQKNCFWQWFWVIKKVLAKSTPNSNIPLLLGLS